MKIKTVREVFDLEDYDGLTVTEFIEKIHQNTVAGTPPDYATFYSNEWGDGPPYFEWERPENEEEIRSREHHEKTSRDRERRIYLELKEKYGE